MSGYMLFVAMALLVAGVECASITQGTGSRSDDSLPISDTATFQKFDSSLGVLTQVTITLTATPTVDLRANNLGTVNNSTLETISASTTMTASAPGVTTTSLTTSATANPQVLLLPNNTGGGYSSTITGALQTISAIYTDSSDLIAYTGTTGTNFTVTIAAGAGTISGTSNPAGLSLGGDISSVTFSYNVTYTYTAVTVSGDPQFVGIQGQRFQIHGIPDEHFNLISTATYTFNSQFVYIASGVCNYNDTQCFSHPGTYIGQVGLLIANNRIKITSGPHANGLSTRINDKSVPVGTHVRLNNETSVRVVSHSHVELRIVDLTISVVNSDLFLNLGVELTNAHMLQAGHVKVIVPTSDSPAKADHLVSSTYPEYQMHGLIGQTWRNIEWPQSRLYQGEPADYQVSDLFATDFVYTQSK